MAKIETKIKIGEKFFVIKYGKLERYTLSVVKAKETENYCSVEYYAKVTHYTGIHAGNNNTDNYECFNEDSCYSTKEELLNSL